MFFQMHKPPVAVSQADWALTWWQSMEGAGVTGRLGCGVGALGFVGAPLVGALGRRVGDSVVGTPVGEEEGGAGATKHLPFCHTQLPFLTQDVLWLKLRHTTCTVGDAVVGAVGFLLGGCAGELVGTDATALQTLLSHAHPGVALHCLWEVTAPHLSGVGGGVVGPLCGAAVVGAGVVFTLVGDLVTPRGTQLWLKRCQTHCARRWHAHDKWMSLHLALNSVGACVTALVHIFLFKSHTQALVVEWTQG